jgi:hypothetical protein
MQKRTVVLLGIGVWLVLGGLAWERTDYGGVRLEIPSFMTLAVEAQAQEQENGVNFLQQEAGISAYVNVGQDIDLAQVRGAFKTVETVSDEYIIGEVALPDLPEEAHPHVYVSKEGWIVAYYTKDEAASKIMYWAVYKGGLITTTTLQQAIRQVFSPVRIEEIKYYNFKYPQANRIVLVTEVLEGGVDSFFLTIPKGLRLFEASWSLYSRYRGNAELRIDEASIGRFSGSGVLYGDLTPRLRVDFRHTITVKWDDESAVIVLIYEE